MEEEKEGLDCLLPVLPEGLSSVGTPFGREDKGRKHGQVPLAWGWGWGAPVPSLHEEFHHLGKVRFPFCPDPPVSPGDSLDVLGTWDSTCHHWFPRVLLPRLPLLCSTEKSTQSMGNFKGFVSIKITSLSTSLDGFIFTTETSSVYSQPPHPSKGAPNRKK